MTTPRRRRRRRAVTGSISSILVSSCDSLMISCAAAAAAAARCCQSLLVEVISWRSARAAWYKRAAAATVSAGTSESTSTASRTRSRRTLHVSLFNARCMLLPVEICRFLKLIENFLFNYRKENRGTVLQCCSPNDDLVIQVMIHCHVYLFTGRLCCLC